MCSNIDEIRSYHRPDVRLVENVPLFTHSIMPSFQARDEADLFCKHIRTNYLIFVSQITYILFQVTKDKEEVF